jgi:hypothetical protein
MQYIVIGLLHLIPPPVEDLTFQGGKLVLLLVYVRKNFSTIFFNVWKKKFHPPPRPLANIFGGNMVSEIQISCRASSVLAGQFWQTPPKLRGTPGFTQFFGIQEGKNLPNQRSSTGGLVFKFNSPLHARVLLLRNAELREFES